MSARSDTAARALLAERLDEQRRRFAVLDPALPEAPAPPAGEVLAAGVAGGGHAAGVASAHTWPVGSGSLLWSATHVTELFPVVGATGAAGLDAVVGSWRDVVSHRLRRERDSAAVVTWPSRDVAATRVFLDHGLVPLAVLALRAHAPVPTPDPSRTDPSLRTRRAGPDDLEACLRLALEELSFSSQVGSSIVRPDAVVIKRTALRDRLGRGEPTWLAERDGVAVGMLECGHAESAPGTWLAGFVPHGRWGYVNCASVSAAERGGGVGRALVAAALPVLQDGARGTYLYYNPPNPLSSVFWPRQGYRPLWTLWETRPAAGLR